VRHRSRIRIPQPEGKEHSYSTPMKIKKLFPFLCLPSITLIIYHEPCVRNALSCRNVTSFCPSITQIAESRAQIYFLVMWFTRVRLQLAQAGEFVVQNRLLSLYQTKTSWCHSALYVLDSIIYTRNYGRVCFVWALALARSRTKFSGFVHFFNVWLS